MAELVYAVSDEQLQQLKSSVESKQADASEKAKATLEQIKEQALGTRYGQAIQQAIQKAKSARANVSQAIEKAIQERSEGSQPGEPVTKQT
jgi:hypothetical protein